MRSANHSSHALLNLPLIVLFVCSGHLEHAGAQNSGTITFKDNAPPATEQQRKDAQEYFAKAQQARDRMQLIGKALRATTQIQVAIGKSGGSAAGTAALRNRIDDWKGVASQLGTIDAGTLTLDDKQLATYPKTALDLAFEVTNASAPLSGTSTMNLSSVKRLAAKTEDFLFQAYDLTTIDHGRSNRVLRTYPYFDLVGQPSVECDTVNTFGRDIKCFPVHSKGIQKSVAWMASKQIDLADFCHTDALESFSREEYGKVEMYIRKQSPISSQLEKRCWD